MTKKYINISKQTWKKSGKLRAVVGVPRLIGIQSDLNLVRSHNRSVKVSAINEASLDARNRHKYFDVAEIREFCSIQFTHL